MRTEISSTKTFRKEVQIHFTQFWISKLLIRVLHRAYSKMTWCTQKQFSAFLKIYRTLRILNDACLNLYVQNKANMRKRNLNVFFSFFAVIRKKKKKMYLKIFIKTKDDIWYNTGNYIYGFNTSKRGFCLLILK